MVTTKSYYDLIKRDVFTTKGSYCGKIADVDLDMERFRVKALIVDAVRGSFLAPMVGEKRGVIVPLTMVQAIGDIVIIKHIQPAQSEEPTQGQPGKDMQQAQTPEVMA